MSSSAGAKAVRFDEDSMWLELSDGRTLAVPLAWFPRLLHGSAEQRRQVEISSRGLHWEALDEDISIAGLLAGRGDQSRPQAPRVAAGTSPDTIKVVKEDLAVGKREAEAGDVRVIEEIGLRKQATDRVETVRDSVRETKVDVENVATIVRPTTNTLRTGTAAGDMNAPRK